MLIRYYTQRSVQYSKILLGSSRNGFRRFAHSSMPPISSGVLNLNCRFSVMAGDVANRCPNPRRTYQVVVAATRDMGIGKDGKLPWILPSDLKYFKQITTTTKDPDKQNAVIMGRKTWESIPIWYQPLPCRLNVVLTRSSGTGIASSKNVTVCETLPLALELLARPPYCSTIENVFIIGGGQIFKETLNASGCQAIHVTEIETSIECDTFMPHIDMSQFRLSHSSPVVENNIRYCFATYVRVRNSACGTAATP